MYAFRRANVPKALPTKEFMFLSYNMFNATFNPNHMIIKQIKNLWLIIGLTLEIMFFEANGKAETWNIL